MFGQPSPMPLKLKPDYWSEKLQKEAEAFAYYRRTHTANERRRRGEMRDLFEKLKITLGLLHSSKVSKSLILTRVSVLCDKSMTKNLLEILEEKILPYEGD